MKIWLLVTLIALTFAVRLRSLYDPTDDTVNDYSESEIAMIRERWGDDAENFDFSLEAFEEDTPSVWDPQPDPNNN